MICDETRRGCSQGKKTRVSFAPAILRTGQAGMFIVYDEEELNGVVKEAFAVARQTGTPRQIFGRSH